MLFIKEDFDKYLFDAKPEFYIPQQDYIKKSQMIEIYERLKEQLSEYKQGVLKFNVYRVNVAPPRVYINSESEYYELMRALGLPNISYISILKLKSTSGKIYYYYRMFIDYQSDIIQYENPLIKMEEEKIANSEISTDKKMLLFQARRGQGTYRKKLLEDCQFCPFTLVDDRKLLIASHIKPWAVCNDEEKIDPKNGFALTPTYDKLFDTGYITFNDDKTVNVSPWISPVNQKRLNIYTGMKVPRLQLDEERMVYLEYHWKHIYKG